LQDSGGGDGMVALVQWVPAMQDIRLLYTVGTVGGGVPVTNAANIARQPWIAYYNTRSAGICRNCSFP